MTTTNKNSVIVELYDNSLTDRKDDRFGRVVTTKSLSEDDLINLAAARHSDITPATMRATLQLLSNIAIEQIANGASVKFGLGYFNLSVNGVFIGDNAKWNSEQHALVVNVTPTSDLRQAVDVAAVDVRGMAAVGIAINKLTDVTSGLVNSKLTPGGGVNLIGSKIKIEGTDKKVGITLVNKATGVVVAIPATSLLVNESSKVTFIVPATLPKGDYKLNLSTQFSGSQKLLKEVRSFLYEYTLTVK